MQRNDKKVLVDTYSFTGNEKACARSSIESSKKSTYPIPLRWDCTNPKALKRVDNKALNDSKDYQT
jgi:hypothetical protein